MGHKLVRLAEQYLYAVTSLNSGTFQYLVIFGLVDTWSTTYHYLEVGKLATCRYHLGEVVTDFFVPRAWQQCYDGARCIKPVVELELLFGDECLAHFGHLFHCRVAHIFHFVAVAGVKLGFEWQY